MFVQATPAAGGDSKVFRSAERTSEDFDCTMRLQLTGLKAGTKYTYRVCFSSTTFSACSDRKFRQGIFETAAEKGEAGPVKIVWSGDLAGQNAW